MPSLAELSDYYPQQDTTLPVASAIPANIPRVYINTAAPAQLPDMTQPITDARPEPLPEPISPQIPDNNGFWSNVGMAGVDDKSGVSENPIIKKLFGLGGEERYQTWPEKVVREALAAPHDTLNSSEPVTSQDLIAPAQAVSALAGTGGLAGADASLGSTAFLRPALKYENKIYKAPMGGQHLDALPAHLAEDFQTKAMNGEDINHYNFGFMNHKGQFLSREAALDYAVKEGLVDPSAGQYGALTSTLMADSSKPGTAIEAMAKSNPFYSALEHNVNAIQQGKMTGDQWLGTLSNKPGVKPEELDWTGTKEFLQNKGNQPVTKAELQEHLANNKVEIKDVDKGEAKPWDSLSKEEKDNIKERYNSRYGNDPNYHPDISVEDFYKANSQAQEASGATKYHSYQLPGGENYREKLLTLPRKEVDVQGQSGTFKSIEPIKYKSSHWDEPNILAHVRMNDRTFPNPEYQNLIDKYGSYDNAAKSATKKEWETIEANKDKKTLKSLHLEEIQSDWHQQGRDKGYKSDVLEKKELTPEEAAKSEHLGSSFANHALKWREENGVPKDAPILAYRRKGNNDWNYSWAPEEYKNDALLKSMTDKNSGVPDAPFKKSWHELALKRMIREAAEKDYDRLSWTPGEAQATRYDLSKSINNVHYDPKVNQITAFDKSSKRVIDQHARPEELPDIMGKEAAKKLLETEIDKNGLHTLEGQDLKIGGEGMKGFYDQIIPKSIEKISGEKIKQFETSPKYTIEEIEVRDGRKLYDVKKDGKLFSSFATKQEADKILKDHQGEIGQQLSYIDIPQSLKDKALGKGFPLFSSTHMFTPVAGNPFEDKK